MEQGAKTALGSARERFIDGLSRRADELRAAITAVRPFRDRQPAREELQRKLHTLLASAQLFERTALAERLQRVTARLDAASKAGEPWTEGDFGLLEGLVVQLANEHLEPAAPAVPVARPAADDSAEWVRAPENGSEIAPGPGSRSLVASNALRGSPRPEQQVEPVSIDLSWRSPARTLPVPVPGDLDEPDPEPTQELAEVPLLVTKTQPGISAAPGVARLLLVCSRPHAVKLREWLEGSPFEIVHAADAEHAVQQLHTANPALALLSAEYANLPDIDLVRRLQTDPLSKLTAVYVLLPEGSTYDDAYLRQTGADGVFVEPLASAQIDALVQQCTRPGRGGLRALSALGDSTVDDIASYVAEEIRSGIADALRAGQNERIRLGDAQELKSAAWSAIGRVRSHLAEQSRGRVAFRDDKIHELSQFLEPERSAAPAPDALKVLAGKRVLVADDDPAVMWFFSGLLREGGAQVLQAQNGRDALALARRKQPQLVLSDILMPKIDGFALCRELQRDALLAHVPVILLSWKDDYLERMRELDAGASGYLRKEAGTKEVLAAINQALLPRQQLVAALKADHELRGRIDGLGVFALLESVAAVRPDARVSIQDAWNVFEVDIRGGQRLSVTRTAADGSFARSERALIQLLGVSTGRFAISPSNSSLRSPLLEPLPAALQSAGKALTALMHAVSDTRLVQVARLAFEDDVVDSLQQRTPTRLHEVVARFKRGASARELLLDGSFTPAELENQLRELARRGAISGVWNAADEDLVAAARREREEQPGALQHSSHPPSAQTTWFSSLRPQRSSEKRESKPPPPLGAAGDPLDVLQEADAALRQLAAGPSRSAPPPPPPLGATSPSNRPPPLPSAALRSQTPASVPGPPMSQRIASPDEMSALVQSADGGGSPRKSDRPPPLAANGTLPQPFVPSLRVPPPLAASGTLPSLRVPPPLGTTGSEGPPPMAAEAPLPAEPAPSAHQTLPQQFRSVVEERPSIVVGLAPEQAAAQPNVGAPPPSGGDLEELLPAALEPARDSSIRQRWSRPSSVGLTAPQQFGLAPHQPAGVSSTPAPAGRPAHAAALRAATGWPLEVATRLPNPPAPQPSAADDSRRLLTVASQLSAVDHAYLSDSAQRQLAAADAADPHWTEAETSTLSDLERAGLRKRRWGEAFEGMRLLLTLAALVAVGYFGWQRFEPGSEAVSTPTPAPSPAASATFSSNTPGSNAAPSSLAPAPSPAAPAAADAAVAPQPPNPALALGSTETTLHSGTDPDLSLGRILPYVDGTRGIPVGPEQGLLVIEYQGDNPAPRIRVAGRELGHPPLAVALNAGRHELVVQRNRESSFRFLVVRAGETRVITLPL